MGDKLTATRQECSGVHIITLKYYTTGVFNIPWVLLIYIKWVTNFLARRYANGKGKSYKRGSFAVNTFKSTYISLYQLQFQFPKKYFAILYFLRMRIVCQELRWEMGILHRGSSMCRMLVIVVVVIVIVVILFIIAVIVVVVCQELRWEYFIRGWSTCRMLVVAVGTTSLICHPEEYKRKISPPLLFHPWGKTSGFFPLLFPSWGETSFFFLFRRNISLLGLPE